MKRIRAGYWLFLLILLGLAVDPGRAAAELSLGLVYSTGTSPYKDYDRQWAVVPMIDFENDRFFVRDLSAGLKFYNSEDLKLGVFLGYDPTSFDGSDSGDRRLRQLDSRHEGLLAGADVQWTSPVGHFSLSLGGDISGHSRGLLGRLAYLYSLDFGTVEFVPQLGTYWASGSYNDYYYGVSRKEARKSGLTAYEAGAAFSPFLGLTIDVVLDAEEHWEIFCYGEAVALPSAVKNSPMVGRSSTRSLTTGLTYTF